MGSLPDYLEISESLDSSLDALREQFKDASAWVVLADENTFEYCYPKIEDHLPDHETIVVPAGESHKNLTTCVKIWEDMTRFQSDRKALLVNLGGGVIGDMGGFAAAAFKRGIRFVNIPTTLLSQVDASIGGKLGIDFHGFKNHIGFFRNPDKVIVHRPFLESLPERELRSGYAEIIKHNLIRDAGNWKELSGEQSWKDAVNLSLIKHSISIKSDIVAEDPYEKGPRKLLNYGHTVGHALETFYLEKSDSLLHGEAIAAGMIIENIISASKDLLSDREMDEANRFILGIYGKVKIKDGDIPGIIDLAIQDKKNTSGQIRAVLLSEIGSAECDVLVSKEELSSSLASYQSLQI